MGRRCRLKKKPDRRAKSRGSGLPFGVVEPPLRIEAMSPKCRYAQCGVLNRLIAFLRRRLQRILVLTECR
jgi:hypothetical protein